VSDSRLAGLLRTKILARAAAFAMSLGRIQRMAFRVVSQTGIHYRKSALSSSLSKLPRGAPRAGDRFPWLRLEWRTGGPVEDVFEKLDDTRFHLIVIGQSAPPETALALGDLLRVHVVPASPINEKELARARIPRPSFYLVRPDGHVALCGARIDGEQVARYLAERLHLERNVRPTESVKITRQ